jgi:hypothetical protein
VPEDPLLDFGSNTAPRLVCLTRLELTAVPIPRLHVSGTPLPQLKYLRVSNEGFALTRPPHEQLHIGPFNTLQALEVRSHLHIA